MDNKPISHFIRPVSIVETYNMAEQVFNVRAKPLKPARRIDVSILKFVIAGLFAVAIGTLGFDAYSGMVGIIPVHFEIVQKDNVRVIKVPPGGNIQAAIEQANSGDIVELQAGAVYSGQINLPNKPLTDYVTIRSSAAADLPPDKRVEPEQKASMAIILSGMLGRAAVAATNGAHHYRFVGIEFATSSASYNYGLIQLGKGEKRPELVPHDIEIDRSYIHPYKSGVTRRGIAINSANTTVKNSYIEGFAYPSEETQGICGWTGARNIRILNNYIEAGAENIMFGGADPPNAELIPADIEIRGNYLTKPAAWKGKVTTKTLFELKDAKRVIFAGNFLTNNWEGSALRITVRNQDEGAPFSTIEDVTIRDNVIKGAGEGINILGRDDTYSSQTLQRLTIVNNLFLDIGGPAYDGSGYFIQVADGRDITIANNTVFNTGNITTFYGAMPMNFVFRDNITNHGSYGIHGLDDVRSSIAQAMFQNNVFVNMSRVPSGDYSFPPGNTIVGSMNDVKFASSADNDYRLAPDSKFRGKARDGKNIGADIAPDAFPK